MKIRKNFLIFSLHPTPIQYIRINCCSFIFHVSFEQSLMVPSDYHPFNSIDDKILLFPQTRNHMLLRKCIIIFERKKCRFKVFYSCRNTFPKFQQRMSTVLQQLHLPTVLRVQFLKLLLKHVLMLGIHFQ